MTTIIEKAPEKQPNYFARRAGALGIAALALLGVAKGHEAMQDGSSKPKAEVTYTVKQGDTAWNIADQLSDKDTRDLSDRLAKQDSDLQPGDQLKIPAEDVDHPEVIEQNHQDYPPQDQNRG